MYGRFQAGYRLKGNLIYSEAADRFVGRIDGTRSHSLRLVIDHTSTRLTNVFLDNYEIGRFQQKFDSVLRGGVLIYNSDDDSGENYKNAGLFQNFELSECKKIDMKRACIGGKSKPILNSYVL